MSILHEFEAQVQGINVLVYVTSYDDNGGAEWELRTMRGKPEVLLNRNLSARDRAMINTKVIREMRWKGVKV